MHIKKLLLVPVLSLLGMNSFAEYQIQYPDIPVTFKDLGQWVPSDPVISTWINVGTPHDCQSASPLENTQPFGLTYTKTFSGCQQSQERTVTTGERHTVSGALRNQVNTTETKVLTDASYAVNSIGTKIVKECGYSAVSGHAYRWYDIATYDGYTTTYGMGLQWDGSTKIDTTNISKTYPKAATFVNGGYTYTRGAFKEKSSHYDGLRSYYYYYEVCRELIAP